MNMAGSNQGASSAYTEAGPPEMMIALKNERRTKQLTKCFMSTFSLVQGNNHVRRQKKRCQCFLCSPVALLSDSKSWCLQRENLRAHAKLSDPPVDYFAILGPSIQDCHSPFARPILLSTADLQLWTHIHKNTHHFTECA